MLGVISFTSCLLRQQPISCKNRCDSNPCSSSSPFLSYNNTSKLLPLEISPFLQTSSRIIETLEGFPLHPIPPPLPSKPFENPHQRQLLATTESKLWDPNEVKLFAFYFRERVPFCMLCLQTQQDYDRFVGIPPTRKL